MNGAASGLIDAFKDAYYGESSDWDYIPSGSTSWFIYGGGGISGWASLCGVPNGCCAVLNLVNLHGALAGEVLGHYSRTTWPTSLVPDAYDSGWTGPVPIPDDEVLAHIKSFSPICHVSISKWCNAAGVNLVDTDDLGRKHKNDRCGKLCADMAAYTAELINDHVQSNPVSDPYIIPAETAWCLTCHKTNSDPGIPAQTGKMDCGQCHYILEPHEGVGPESELHIDDVWTADENGDGKVEFSRNDTIRYYVRFTVRRPGACWVESTPKTKGRGLDWIDKLPQQGDTYYTGSDTWYWERTIPGDAAFGEGKFVCLIKMRHYEGGPKLFVWKEIAKFNIS